VFGSEYLTEKLETAAGWSPPQPDEDWAQGHRHMIQDFVASVAEGRPPVADGALGADVIRVIYAAYIAADEGRRIELSLG
jgi:predicted dehydrogenase